MTEPMNMHRRALLRNGVTTIAATAIPSASMAAPRTTGSGDARANAAFTDRLHAMRVATGVTGASFAYWDGGTLHTAVSGLRNSVTGDPVTPDTVMHVGSITKLMNAALLMQLVDDGKIALDDPVLHHLPDLRLRDTDALKKINCAMLVNHTSGIDGEWFPEYGPDQERIIDTVIRSADLGQLFSPGTETSYCNVATVIAGHLTQTVRAKSWYSLVKSRIYEPLGMRHALVDPLELPRFRASIGDLTNSATGKMVQTTRPFLAPSFAPAGSTQMTSAADLVTFARALMEGGIGPNGGRILSGGSARRMFQPTASFVPVGGIETSVGLGWMIMPGGLVGHGGSGPGVRSNLFAHPASGRALALLTNCDKGEALRAAFVDPILQSWTGLSPGMSPTRRSVADLEPYLGVYETNADRYTVVAHGGLLSLQVQDKLSTYDNSNQDVPPRIFYPLGDDSFEEGADRVGGQPQTIRFIRPGAGGKMHFLSSGNRLLARIS